VKDGLEIVAVSHVSEVLEHALTGTPEAIEWDEAAEEAAAAAATGSDAGVAGATAH
jgi:ATP-dependent Lon protease